jgi:hypothetical protein
MQPSVSLHHISQLRWEEETLTAKSWQYRWHPSVQAEQKLGTSERSFVPDGKSVDKPAPHLPVWLNKQNES